MATASASVLRSTDKQSLRDTQEEEAWVKRGRYQRSLTLQRKFTEMALTAMCACMGIHRDANTRECPRAILRNAAKLCAPTALDSIRGEQ